MDSYVITQVFQYALSSLYEKDRVPEMCICFINKTGKVYTLWKQMDLLLQLMLGKIANPCKLFITFCDSTKRLNSI